jgi:hypothetical protein
VPSSPRKCASGPPRSFAHAHGVWSRTGYRQDGPDERPFHPVLQWRQSLGRYGQADASKGTLIEPGQRRTLIDELYTALLVDYRNNERASLEDAEQCWAKRLKPFFSGLRAANITRPLLDRYVASCRTQGLANATINRHLACLRRSLNLAKEAGTLAQVPTFPHLAEGAPRSGFVEEEQYDKLAKGAREL